MKICLLGQFGSGNSGNDGSLESMLNALKALRPDADLFCICSNPAVVEARYKIKSISVRATGRPSPSVGALTRIIERGPRRMARIVASLTQLAGTDLMMLPGTGILDDFQETAFGWPLVVFLWCLACRATNTPIAFVSIGAGPIEGRLSRWLLSTATKMASYRSYRDDYSLEFTRTLGVDVSRDHRFPDLAFDLPRPDIPGDRGKSPILSIGIGIMTYRGWRRNHARGHRIYRRYIRKMADLVGRLARQGYRVRVFMGDIADGEARDDIASTLQAFLTVTELSRVEFGTGGSLQEVMEQVLPVDVAIVSRYHNLISALKMDCPTISLGYAMKNDNLMSDFGQSAYCRHIETFEVADTLDLLDTLLDEIDSARNRIREANLRARVQLKEQQALLSEQLFLPVYVSAPISQLRSGS